MGILPCPLPCQSKKKSTNVSTTTTTNNKSNSSDHLYSSSSSSSSSSSKSLSSLYSQPSLPSIPSLTQPSSSTQTQTQTQLISQSVTTYKGNNSSIFCLSLVGKHLYSGNSNGEIIKYNKDPLTLQNHSTIVAHSKSAVKSIVILGDKLFSAHQDHKIRVWKVENGGVVRYSKLPLCTGSGEGSDHKGLLYSKCIATLPTLNDRCMRLFNAKNYVEIRRNKTCTFVHHVDAISALALSIDGSVIYSASWDRSFKIWRSSDFKCLESVWNAHDDAINAIALSKDGYVYTGSADQKIKVWKKEDGEKKIQHTLIDTLEKHKSAVNALAICTNGSILYSGACDRSIIVWEKDHDNGKMVVGGALRGHTKAILCLAVVSDVVSDHLVCSGSADKTVRIWRKEIIGKSYSCLAVFDEHKGPVKCLTATIDNSNSNNSSADIDGFEKGNSCVVYSGSLDCDIKVWKFWVPYL